MPTFMERMRAPLLSMGPRGSETAGESDALSRAASFAELERNLGGPNRNNLAMRSGGGASRDPNAWIKQTAIMRRGLPAGVENVVYDQRPENFKKEMDLKNREVDAKLAMTESINAIRQQQADATAKRADAYDFGVRNPLGQVVTPRGGNTTVIDRRTGRAIDTGVAGGTMTQEDELLERARIALEQGAQRGEIQSNLETQRQGGRMQLGEMANQAAAARAATAATEARTRQGEAQEFQANRPREQAAAIQNKARELAAKNPELAANMVFDDKGNFTFADGTDEMTQRIITEKIYGPQARDINLGKGSDASALNNPAGAVSSVPMIAPDGRTLNVPPNRVAEMEARGAKRK